VHHAGLAGFVGGWWFVSIYMSKLGEGFLFEPP
jgi:hypothetical protein